MPKNALVIALATVGALVLATILAEHLDQAGPGWLLALDVVAGVAGLALLGALERRPEAVTLLLALLSASSPALVPTSTLAIVHVARFRPLRTASWVAAAGVVGHLLRAGWRPFHGLGLGWYALLVVAVYAALVGWGARSRLNDELIASLRERARSLEAEQDRLLAEARMAERTRVAREMHDGLAHRLSMVAMHAGALEFRPDAPPTQVADAAGVVREGVHQALDELRDVILLLRDEGEVSLRRPLPGLSDLPALIAELEQVGVRVQLEHTAPTVDLDPAASRAAYRVVQEALTNARRHAPGTTVTISLTGRPGDRLVIVVTNPTATASPGPPAAVAASSDRQGTGLGLVGLRERVVLAGGELEVADLVSEFRVVAWLPWPDE